jgi:hypothetical protein
VASVARNNLVAGAQNIQVICLEVDLHIDISLFKNLGNSEEILVQSHVCAYFLTLQMLPSRFTNI